MAQFDITIDVEVDGEDELDDATVTKIEEALYGMPVEKSIEDALAFSVDLATVTVTNVQS